MELTMIKSPKHAWCLEILTDWDGQKEWRVIDGFRTRSDARAEKSMREYVWKLSEYRIVKYARGDNA